MIATSQQKSRTTAAESLPPDIAGVVRIYCEARHRLNEVTGTRREVDTQIKTAMRGEADASFTLLNMLFMRYGGEVSA